MGEISFILDNCYHNNNYNLLHNDILCNRLRVIMDIVIGLVYKLLLKHRYHDTI